MPENRRCVFLKMLACCFVSKRNTFKNYAYRETQTKILSGVA